MRLVDANVLLHAVNDRAREHATARDWMTRALSGGETVGFSWLVALAFLRLSTHPAIFPSPLDSNQAARQLELWLESGPAAMVEPGRRHLTLLRGLLAEAGTAGNLVNDAHLAALALEHQATIVSFDRDFGRFEGVESVIPD